MRRQRLEAVLLARAIVDHHARQAVAVVKFDVGLRQLGSRCDRSRSQRSGFDGSSSGCAVQPRHRLHVVPVAQLGPLQPLAIGEHRRISRRRGSGRGRADEASTA